MGGRGFESRQKRPKLKDENICILGDASFSHKKSIPDQKGARSSASISRVYQDKYLTSYVSSLEKLGRPQKNLEIR